MAEEISNEQIKRIKEVIKLHKKSLNLTGLGLTSISKEILGCSDLEELYIGGNHLSSFPPEIFELKHLRILDLSVNEMSEIPLSVFSRIFSKNRGSPKLIPPYMLEAWQIEGVSPVFGGVV
jgi:Leucine-rich repeat (LRR) protein